MSDRYKLLHDVGLTTIQIKWPMTAYDWSHAVNADDVLALLEKGVKVSVRSGYMCGLATEANKLISSESEALLINIKPIEKNVTKTEVIDLLKTQARILDYVKGSPMYDLISRIEKMKGPIE